MLHGNMLDEHSIQPYRLSMYGIALLPQLKACEKLQQL